MISDNEVPRLLGSFGKVKQCEIVGGNQTLLHQQRPINEAFPEVLAHEDDGDVAGFARLQKRQRLEQFVERAEPAGKHDQGPGAEEEVHLAQGEITKLEAEIRRDVGIGVLFMRECDVEPHGLRACIGRSTVGGLHDAWTPARDDNVLALTIELTGGGNQAAKLPRDVIIARQGEATLRHGHASLQRSVLRAGMRFRCRLFPSLAGEGGFEESRTPEDDNGRTDAVFRLNELRFEQLQSQAHGAKLIALKKVDVSIGWNIRGGRDGVVTACGIVG